MANNRRPKRRRGPASRPPLWERPEPRPFNQRGDEKVPSKIGAARMLFVTITGNGIPRLAEAAEALGSMAKAYGL